MFSHSKELLRVCQIMRRFNTRLRTWQSCSWQRKLRMKLLPWQGKLQMKLLTTRSTLSAVHRFGRDPLVAMHSQERKH